MMNCMQLVWLVYHNDDPAADNGHGRWSVVAVAHTNALALQQCDYLAHVDAQPRDDYHVRPMPVLNTRTVGRV